MVDRSVNELVLASERRLLDPTVRDDAVELDLLLDEDFTEIGQSGRVWSRAETLRELHSTASEGVELVVITESGVAQIADGLHLLTYRLVVGDRASRRSSIWRVEDGRARIVFHQGTPISA